MNKKRIYQRLELKKSLRLLPKVFVAFIIIAMVLIVAGFGITKVLDSSEVTEDKFKIALVVNDDNRYTRMALTFLLQEESLQEMCIFEEMNEEIAAARLQNNQVGAIVIIPENFLVSLLNGTNIPARVVINNAESNGNNTFFRELIDSAASDLATAQAAVYAVDDLCLVTGIDAIQKSEDYLNKTLLMYALSRNAYYDHIDVSATGDVPLDIFYISGGVVLLMLVLIIICREIVKRDSEVMTDMLRRNGIDLLWIYLSKFVGAMCIYCGIFIPVYIVYIVVTSTVATSTVATSTVTATSSLLAITAVIVLIFTAVSFGMLMLWLIENVTAASLSIFGASIIMMFASGNIIPSVFLGKGLNAIGKLMPTGYMSGLCADVMMSTVEVKDIFICFGFGVLFIAVALVPEIARRIGVRS